MHVIPGSGLGRDKLSIRAIDLEVSYDMFMFVELYLVESPSYNLLTCMKV